jgi:hypothetical protein
MAATEPAASERTWASAERVFSLCPWPEERTQAATRFTARPPPATASIQRAFTSGGVRHRSRASTTTQTDVRPRKSAFTKAASTSARREP